MKATLLLRNVFTPACLSPDWILDKGFSAWYKMLSNAAVQYLVSRADLKEMASTINQNNTPPLQKKWKASTAKGSCLMHSYYHSLAFPSSWFLSGLDITDKYILCLYVFVCACVYISSLKGECESIGGEERESIKLNAGCQDGNDICFLSHQRCTIPAFVLQSCERPRFNACRLTMHCYYTVFMFTSCVIWPKESLQSESLMQNLCLYGCFSQWKNQYCRLDAQKWLSAFWLTLKALGDWGAAFAVQGIECIRALIIVCSPYISLSLGLFFDNNYDCGV